MTDFYLPPDQITGGIPSSEMTQAAQLAEAKRQFEWLRELCHKVHEKGIKALLDHDLVEVRRQLKRLPTQTE